MSFGFKKLRARLRRQRSKGEKLKKRNGSGAQRKSADVQPNVETSSGLAIYAEFVKGEVAAQDQRKSSFEQRALAVITTAGTLVTLLFALAAFSTKAADTFVLPKAAQTWLQIALALLFVSALFALLVNVPRKYQAADIEDIRERLKEKPPRTAEGAHKDIALTQLKTLAAAKQRNHEKALLLASAMAFEAFGVGCVAAAVAHIL